MIIVWLILGWFMLIVVAIMLSLIGVAALIVALLVGVPVLLLVGWVRSRPPRPQKPAPHCDPQLGVPT